MARDIPEGAGLLVSPHVRCQTPCMPTLNHWFLALLVASATSVCGTEPAISPAASATNGFVVHTVQSELQSGSTKIYVRAPDKIPSGARLPVLYLANKLNVVVAYPTFSHLPWFCDHPTDLGIRQETYFLKVVVPFVERAFPARAERNARLLLGFSKSDMKQDARRPHVRRAPVRHARRDDEEMPARHLHLRPAPVLELIRRGAAQQEEQLATGMRMPRHAARHVAARPAHLRHQRQVQRRSRKGVHDVWDAPFPACSKSSASRY